MNEVRRAYTQLKEIKDELSVIAFDEFNAKYYARDFWLRRNMKVQRCLTRSLRDLMVIQVYAEEYLNDMVENQEKH